MLLPQDVKHWLLVLDLCWELDVFERITIDLDYPNVVRVVMEFFRSWLVFVEIVFLVLLDRSWTVLFFLVLVLLNYHFMQLIWLPLLELD